VVELDLLEVMHEEIVESARRMGVPGKVASDLALSVEAGIRDRCGVGRHYVPGNSKGTRNSFIFAAFSSGEDLKNIARRYEITIRQVRRILEGYGVSWETSKV